MASQTAAALISLAEVLFEANHCIVASSTFLIYDYVITFSQEVAMFWNAKPTGASVLFFANRYLTLLFNVLAMAQLGKFSDKSCATFRTVFPVISYMQYIVWALFSGLRAYALCKNRVLSAIVCIVALVPSGLGYAQFAFGLTGTNDPNFGCFSDTSLTAAQAQKLTIASRTCIISADATLIFITWAALAAGSSPFALMRRNRWSLSTILLRDGTIYFVVLLILNVLHLTFTVSSVFGHLLSNIAIFTDEISAVLVNRFLLDLQAASRRTLKLGSDDPLHLSTASYGDGRAESVTFARVVGSLSLPFTASGATDSDEDFDGCFDGFPSEDPAEELELSTVAAGEDESETSTVMFADVSEMEATVTEVV